MSLAADVFDEQAIEVRNEVIAAGRESVELKETRDYRKRGCLIGFEICSKLNSIAEFEKLLSLRRVTQDKMRGDSDMDKEKFWMFYCATAQIEHVYERMKVVCGTLGMDNKEPTTMARIQVANLLHPKAP